jgi:hypothetical protein
MAVSLEHPMFVIIVSAPDRFGAFVPVQPALGTDDDATDLDHGTTLASETAPVAETYPG